MISQPEYWGGLDWSGRPTPGDGLYVVCVCLIRYDPQSPARLNKALLQLRQRLGMPKDQEFHAHRMVEAQMIALIETVLPLNLRIGCLMIDKGRTEAANLPSPADLAAYSALTVLDRMLKRHCVVKLWHDSEIEGKKKQRDFKTSVERVNRSHRPQTKIDVQCRASHSSDMIQLADVIAYGFSRWANGKLRTQEIRQSLDAIRKHPENWVAGPCGWGAEGE